MTQPDEISQVVTVVTRGHCEQKKQAGGCQRHNLHCGWPKCDERHELIESPTPAVIDSAPVYSKPIDATPAEARGEMEPAGWIGTNHRTGAVEICAHRPADSVIRDFNMRPVYHANDYATLARQLAEAKAEREQIVKRLGCHPAYLLAELDSVTERAESTPNADDYRQMQCKLAQAAARLAAVEGVLQDMLDLRDATQRCELHPKGELVIVKAARAALQPKEL